MEDEQAVPCADPQSDGRRVVLAVGVAEVDKSLCTTADEEGAATEQIAGFPHAFGADVGLGQHAAAKQDGNLVALYLVGLGLVAVDGIRVERVSEVSSLGPAGRSALSSPRVREHSD